ncbi:SsgA family sporulation/cell division regulator [Streptomyces corynorhini]|uniref:SsgA family sporulation/cell division regulator n=1 Tax=Streptomyces corynorhini TaxID=2282652 RepID=A0A370B687_9ACTN|nr:SsgA family sporulation/cell division regulator [Streptomyces corynorhini]
MELRCGRRDPFAVEIAFHGPGGSLPRWRFSRDLLLAGLHGGVGEGEVMIWPPEETSAGRALLLRLGPRDRHALFRGTALHHEPLARAHRRRDRSGRP